MEDRKASAGFDLRARVVPGIKSFAYQELRTLLLSTISRSSLFFRRTQPNIQRPSQSSPKPFFLQRAQSIQTKSFRPLIHSTSFTSSTSFKQDISSTRMVLTSFPRVVAMSLLLFAFSTVAAPTPIGKASLTAPCYVSLSYLNPPLLLHLSKYLITFERRHEIWICFSPDALLLCSKVESN